MVNGEVVGTLSYHLTLRKSKLYVQQMECVVFSEHGIVMATASDFGDHATELDGPLIRHYLLQLRSGKAHGVGDFEFFRMLEDLYKVLREGTEFHIEDDLAQTQETVLDFIEELADLLEEDKLLKNEFIWKILDLVLHKKLMNLRYFGSTRDPAAQKRYARKYYRFLINTLVRIIQFVINGISFKELVALQKFVAYAFFRLAWVQDQIITALARPTDPTLSEERIIEIGASARVRSPSKSYFYDWETNVLSPIRKEDDCQKLMLRLEKAAR